LAPINPAEDDLPSRLQEAARKQLAKDAAYFADDGNDLAVIAGILNITQDQVVILLKAIERALKRI
jgi:hypothetical protein